MVGLWILAFAQVPCLFDFSHYPIDTQTCFFLIEANQKTIEKQVYDSKIKIIREEAMKIPMYHVSYGQIPTEMKRSTSGMSNRTYSTVGFQVTLKRKVLPFILNIFIPTEMLKLIAFVSFLIPVDMVKVI